MAEAPRSSLRVKEEEGSSGSSTQRGGDRRPQGLWSLMGASGAWKDTPLAAWGSWSSRSVRKSWSYLFRWSSRKRKVSRLASGSDSSKFSMQLSFATGSERAAVGRRGHTCVLATLPGALVRGHRTVQGCHPPGPYSTGPRLGPRDGCRRWGWANLNAFSVSQGANGTIGTNSRGCWTRLLSRQLSHSCLLPGKAQTMRSRAWNGATSEEQGAARPGSPLITPGPWGVQDL